MDPRYEIAIVSETFRPRNRYALWLEVGHAVVKAQAKLGMVPQDAADHIVGVLHPDDLGSSHVSRIEKWERKTDHDVAAFLSWWESACGPGHGRWVGYGLTSSDLVETALGLQFKNLEYTFESFSGELERWLKSTAKIHTDTPLLGRTHGQPAEPTTLGLRLRQWQGMIHRSRLALSLAWNEMKVCKISGPVGTFSLNPLEVEHAVSNELGLYAVGHTSTQVVPRDRMARWASAAAQTVAVCAKIGVDFRLMASRGEVQEHWPQERIGSSAMPHKRNPVKAERLAGLSRLAAGYAAMLQPVDLWEERDISHSSVERVAIPDLMHVLFFALDQAHGLLSKARWDEEVMANGLLATDRLPYTSRIAMGHVGGGASRSSARQAAMEWADGAIDPPRPTWFEMVRNHPNMKPVQRPS